MVNYAWLIFALVLLPILLFALVAQKNRRETVIRQYRFPPGLYEKVMQRHPHLTTKDMDLVARGLRQFFMAHLQSGRRFVAMPSQVADDLWHEFILYTRHYQSFCNRAFGRFMHHTRAVVLGKGAQSDEGLKRCWHHVCLQERIDPKRAFRLPVLFALDAQLGIANGFTYEARCDGVMKEGGGKDEPVYCGSDLAANRSDGGCGGGGGGSGCSGGSDGGGDGGCGGGD